MSGMRGTFTRMSVTRLRFHHRPPVRDAPSGSRRRRHDVTLVGRDGHPPQRTIRVITRTGGCARAARMVRSVARSDVGRPCGRRRGSERDDGADAMRPGCRELTPWRCWGDSGVPWHFACREPGERCRHAPSVDRRRPWQLRIRPAPATSNGCGPRTPLGICPGRRCQPYRGGHRPGGGGARRRPARVDAVRLDDVVFRVRRCPRRGRRCDHRPHGRHRRGLAGSTVYLEWHLAGRFDNVGFLDDDVLVEPSGVIVESSGIAIFEFSGLGHPDRLLRRVVAPRTGAGHARPPEVIRSGAAEPSPARLLVVPGCVRRGHRPDRVMSSRRVGTMSLRRRIARAPTSDRPPNEEHSMAEDGSEVGPMDYLVVEFRSGR